MIEFTCPGCLSRCVANGAFSGMRARCVVCGAFIRIPKETGAVAFPLGPVPAGPLPDRQSKAATASTSAKPPKPSVRPRSESGLIVLPDPDGEPPRANSAEYPDDTPAESGLQLVEEPATAGGTKTEAKPKKDAKKGAKKPKLAGADLDGKLNWEDFGAEGPPPEAPEEAPKSRMRQVLIIGGSVAAAVVIAVVLAFTGGEKPKLPLDPPTVENTPEPPPPPPKKEEKKPEPKAPPPLEVAPLPRPADNPNRFVAAQLLAERIVNPAAFDALYRGKLFLLRGTYSRTAGGILYLAERAEEEGGIACIPPKVSKKEPTEPPPEASLLQSGQAVLVRGWYAGELRFTDCRIVATSGPADDEYRDKIIELVGTIRSVNPVDPDSADRFPLIVLEPASTDCPVSVRCLFRITEREKLTTLKPGQMVTIRGRCEGRSFRVVRLHDCALVPNADQPSPGVVRVPADRFFTAYEVDLLHYDRPNPTVPPISITAEQLAAAFGTDPNEANATYRYKTVSVTGKVVERRIGSVTLETGTSHKYQVVVRFTPQRFAAVKDHPVLTIRGVCVGVLGRFVRLENGEAVDAEATNPAARITPEYFPIKPGRELIYDLLTPTGLRDNHILRLSVKFTASDVVHITPLRSGTFPKATLFDDPPTVAKWSPAKPKTAGQTSELRLNEDMIEIRDRPTPPAQPGSWWDPVLKIGGRRGETWTSTMPDGRTVTYTIMVFRKDEFDRNTVEIQRVLKHPKDTLTWEEATITYALGIGQIRRVITKQSKSGKAYTISEMKWVEGETPTGPEPKTEPDPQKPPEPKKEPDPLKKDKKDEK